MFITFLKLEYFFKNFKFIGFNPNKSSVTKIWPSQFIEEPIPIVGILTEDVISFAKDFSTHSNTIENTPEDSKIFASFKILFLSAIFFP